jgi:hypothetical protein
VSNIKPNIQDLTQEELEGWLRDAYKLGWGIARRYPNHNLKGVNIGWGLNDLSRPMEFPAFLPKTNPRFPG